jgi:2-keto-4-pentenoate hydratase/2-oxohepta-3-ene-1,7-dioic acid hydratase in catechol pathway
MKLLRYGAIGHEKPAMLDSKGAIRDLSGHLADIDTAIFGGNALARIASLDPSTLSVVDESVRIGVPIKGIGKFVAIGLNYSDHAVESRMAIPTEPIIFSKATSCLSGPNDDVMLPKDSVKGDWEVELGVVIGRTARSISEKRALDHVAGYLCVNDVSEREYQLERGSQWDKGKGFDTFGPVGPWFVTSDEVGDPQNLSMFLKVNDKTMQTGNTRNMIFGVAQLVSFVSRCMTLYPGDLLTTGTPSGVGVGQKPKPIFLKAGDRMQLGIEKLGEQNQRVVAFRDLGEEVFL